MAIGAPDHSDYTGRVRVYEYLNGSWTQMGQDIEGEGAGFLGNSVSLSSDGLILSVGAPRVDQVMIFSYGSSEIHMDIPNTQLSIYPNPTNGILNIDSHHDNIVSVIISDGTGRQQFMNKPTKRKETVNMCNLENGMYTVRIQTKEDMFFSKIIKK